MDGHIKAVEQFFGDVDPRAIFEIKVVVGEG
jgi:hypothetical protein